MLSAMMPEKAMMQVPHLWPAAVRLQLALYPDYAPVMQTAGAEMGLTETAVESLAFVLGNFDVVPLSAELMWQRMPYKSIAIYRRMINTLVAAGMMEHAPGFGYFLTDAARQAGWHIYGRKHNHLAQSQPLPTPQLHQLAALLHRVVHHSRAMPGLPDRRWLMSRNAYLRHDAAPLARIVEYLADLNAFRDDCYLSAWQTLNIGAHAWEALTLIWKRGNHSLNDLYECLHKHGYTRFEYEHALETLLARGWLAKTAVDNGVFQLTGNGRQALEQVERNTNAAFYTPWHILQGHELFNLDSMFIYLAANLNGRSTLLPI